MPNPKGNLDWKPKYGETTKVVRLPASLANNVTALLKKEVSAIDVLLQLESVPLLHRSQLPSVAVVYLVYQGERLLYIGRTENLKQRWSGHHRQKQFTELEDVRIAWFPCAEDAPLLESTLIELLEPEFNGQEQIGSRVISFRLTAQEVHNLRQRALSTDESPATIAQRLLGEILGVSMELLTPIDTMTDRINAIVDAKLEKVIDKRIQECLQEHTATMLGESNAG